MNNDEFYNLNNHILTDEEQERYYPLKPEVKQKWQKWVPEGYKITNMQIYEAMSRGIPSPNGDLQHDQEYRQFLDEHVLEPVKKVSGYPSGGRQPKRTGIDPFVPGKPHGYGGGGNYPGYTGNEPTPRKPVHDDPEPIIIPRGPIEEEITPIKTTPAPIDDEITPIKIPTDSKTSEPQTTDPKPDEKIEESDIIKAINEELSKDEKNSLVKVVERKKSLLLPLIIAAILALLASFFRIVGPTVNINKTKEEIITKTLTYVMEQDISYEEAFRIATSDIQMGDEYYLPNGEKFNTNSMMSGDENVPGVTKELGKEFDAEGKYEGTYPITGFSIIRNSDNKILAYIEDFYSPSDTTKLSNFVDETLAGTDIDYEDIRVEFHFGRTDSKTGERSRLGWIDNGELVLNEEKIKDVINDAATYQGTVENFSGDFITITTKDGNVTIPVKDANGNYYKPGDVVVGSDNNKYEISTLNLEENVEYIEHETEEVSKRKISFSVKNCNLLAAAPFIGLAVADYLIKKKKNEEAKKNPYYSFVGEENMNQYTEDFHNRKGKFGVVHDASVYTTAQLERTVIDAYYEKTGVKVQDISELEYYALPENKFFVLDKEDQTTTYDITEYVNKHLGEGQSIGTGWDPDAAEYFEEKGRGTR